MQPCHGEADELAPEQMRGALSNLIDDMYASSSRAPRDALLKTWTRFHHKWFGEQMAVLPITEDKLLKVSALFKAGGYKSVKNYLSRIKEYHITSGFDWNDRLDIISKKCARSALRGLGGAHRSEAFDLVAVCERLQDSKGPLTKDGPINPVAMILTSTLFMLRELEASSLEVRDITFTERAVSLRLPVSKVDWQAKGCTRTWNCLCDRQLPCVMHILRDHVEDLKEHKANIDSMLFPTAAGRVCSKQSVVDTIRKAVDMAGGSAKDTSGNWRISGHTFRITGARTLCRWGLDPITIQLIGRWGSSAVLTYLSEAPLEGFHDRLAGGGDPRQVRPFQSLAREQFNTDVDQWIDVENLIAEHNALAGETTKLKHDIARLSRQLEDTEHKLEGIAETVSTDAVRSEVWNVHNIISDVHHRSMVDFNMPPAEWKTFCGWQYAGKPHAHTSKDFVETGRKLCPRCYPSADDNTSSSSSTSSTED
eukprot:s1576_g6.t1